MIANFCYENLRCDLYAAKCSWIKTNDRGRGFYGTVGCEVLLKITDASTRARQRRAMIETCFIVGLMRSNKRQDHDVPSGTPRHDPHSALSFSATTIWIKAWLLLGI